MAFFAVLAILMVIASYLFVLILAAVCIYLPYLAISAGGSRNVQVLGMFVFGIVTAATMLWSLVPRRDSFVAPGLPLVRSDQRQLFAELDDIAGSLNERLPGEVYLIPHANAFVADRGGIMGFGSRRVMGLGLPLFSVLTVSQFRAVLAHEFAHYYGGDTSLGPWLYRANMAIVRISQNVGSFREVARMPVLGIMYIVVSFVLKAYFQLFVRAIKLVSRRKEFRADELACLIVGRQPLIEGLRAIHGAGMAWPLYWQNEVLPVLGRGFLPPIGDGFARFLTAPQISDGVSKSLEKNLQEAKTNPYDTHPPLRHRITATESLPELSAQEDARPATDLLDQLQNLEQQFIEDRVSNIKPGTLKYVSWDEVDRRVRIPSWQKAVATHAAVLKGVTAESIPDQIPRFPEIGARIPDPKGMLLTSKQRTQRAAQVFAAALVLALIENRWELCVQPGIFRLRRGSDELNPFLVVQELMEGKRSSDDWVRQCKTLGISQVSLSAAESLVARPLDRFQQQTPFDA